MHPTERHLLGSVTEGVLRRSRCPVLVLPDHGEEGTEDAPGRVHSALRKQLDAAGQQAPLSRLQI
jgi:hypothetical protein